MPTLTLDPKRTVDGNAGVFAGAYYEISSTPRVASGAYVGNLIVEGYLDENGVADVGLQASPDGTSLICRIEAYDNNYVWQFTMLDAAATLSARTIAYVPPTNPLHYLAEVATDGVTTFGTGVPGDPIVAVGGDGGGGVDVGGRVLIAANTVAIDENRGTLAAQGVVDVGLRTDVDAAAAALVTEQTLNANQTEAIQRNITNIAAIPPNPGPATTATAGIVELATGAEIRAGSGDVGTHRQSLLSPTLDQLVNDVNAAGSIVRTAVVRRYGADNHLRQW